MKINVSTLDYDNIRKALIFKKLNPPQFRFHKFNSNSYLGTVLSRAIHLTIDVHGLGTIRQYFIYDINNKICKYRNSFYSEKQRIEDWKQNKRKKKLVKKKLVPSSIEDK
jgi:hypothetical protein